MKDYDARPWWLILALVVTVFIWLVGWVAYRWMS